MDAGPPPGGGGLGGAGGSGDRTPPGKGDPTAEAPAQEVVPVFAADLQTTAFVLLLAVLGLFKAVTTRCTC